jgi:hypothetical protein
MCFPFSFMFTVCLGGGDYIYSLYFFRIYLQIKDNKIQRYCVVPKIEYQTEYGAQCLTRSELTRQWISLYVRPGADLYRGMLLYFAVRWNSNVIFIVSIKLQIVR